MDNFRSVVSIATKDYGKVAVRLAELLEEKGITRNYLRTLTGIKYDVIDRYFKAENIEMVDLDFLAKVCYALDCDIKDLLVYHNPETK